LRLLYGQKQRRDTLARAFNCKRQQPFGKDGNTHVPIRLPPPRCNINLMLQKSHKS
jgi:hypothetical protein